MLLKYIMTTITNAKNLRQYETRFFFIVEKKLAFASSVNLAGEVKNVSPNFKRLLDDRYFSLGTVNPSYRKTFISSAKGHV